MNEQDSKALEEEQRRQEQKRASQLRAESQAAEEHQRQEKQRWQDDRRKEDATRQTDERRRQNRNRQEAGMLHEATIKTLSEKPKENEQAQYARKNGVVYVETGSVVNEMTRNISSVQRAEYERRDGKEPTGQIKEQLNASPQKSKDSAIMEQLKSQIEVVKPKVAEQNKGQGIIQGKGG